MLAALLCAWMLAAPAIVQSTSGPAPSSGPFLPGASIDREIRPDEEHRYVFALAAGDAAQFEMLGDLDLAVTLVRPGETRSVLVASMQDQLENVSITVLARETGDYSLVLRMSARSTTGSYHLGFVGVHAEREADRQRERAEALVQEGIAFFKDTRREARLQAVERYEQSLALWRLLGDRLREAVVLSKVGQVFNRLGEARRASQSYAEARDVFHELGNRLEEASMLNNLGLEYMNLGEYAKAVDVLTSSAAMFHELGHKSGERSPHNNLGLTYVRMGELEKGREQYEMALALARETSDRSGEAYADSGLAGLAIEAGRFQEALDDTSRALEIFRALGNRQLEAQMLGYLGSIHLRIGEPTLALDYLMQAQELGKLAPNRTRDAAILGNITAAYTQLGDTARAMTFAVGYRDAWHDLGNKAQEADADTKIAALYLKLARVGDAAEAYAIARTLAHESAASGTEALALIGLSQVKLTENAAADSIGLAREAADIATRDGLQMTREQALASMARAELALDELAAARQHLEEALALAESFRASVAGSDLRTSYFTSVHAQYELLIDVLMRLHRQRPAESFDARAFEVSERARARALLDLLSDARSEIREGPAAFTQSHPASLDDIRREVLDDSTSLVEYALGDARSYVWVVTGREVFGRELPSRAVIDEAARKAYASLTSPNAPEPREPLRALGRLVFEPIADRITTRRVAIVSEGALQYVPFTTLPDAAGRPLVAEKDVVSLPSASTLQVLRRELAGRAPAPQGVLVVGDPVFDRRDARVRAPAGVPPPVAATVERSARESGVSHLERLYFTRREADSIAALARSERPRELLDFDANLDRIKDDRLGSYRFVHLATHGLLNNQHPELSGLVFSLVDQHGRPRDGFLSAYDIYQLRLNADLVVLSACQTALGGDVRGEGLVGLTRAFMYAGTPRVVASLWRVPDQATAALMQSFYRAMLVDHLRPAAALRAAQLTIRDKPQWSAPYYWAGFILQGEWR